MKPQPIETAPKDRAVLAWWPLYQGWETTRWDIEEYHKSPRPHWWSHAMRTWIGMRVLRANQPTHWVPLPDPPGEDK